MSLYIMILKEPEGLMDKTKAESISTPKIKKLEKKLKESKDKGIDEYAENTIKTELGQAYLDIGEIERALDLYSSLSEETHKEEKFQGIFRAYIESERYDEAKKLIPLILKDFSESFSLLNSLGLFYYRTGDNYEALRYFDKAKLVASDPEDTMTVLYNKAITLNQVGYYEEALKILKPFASALKDNNFATELAYCYTEKGEPKKAVEIYEGLRNDGVINSSMYGGLYCAYLKLGKYDKAFKIAKEGVKRLPQSHTGLYENLAEAYQRAGILKRDPSALKKAMNIVNKGLEIFPDDNRLLKVRNSNEEDTKFLEEDLKMDTWRQGFRESSLTEDKAPVLVLVPFSLSENNEDKLDNIFDYLGRKNWFNAGRLFSFDTENLTILYRKNIGLGLDDYLEKVKKGARLIVLEIDIKKRFSLNERTISVCTEKNFSFLQCNVICVGRTIRGVIWSNLLQFQ